MEGSLKRLQTDYVDVYIEHQMQDGTEEQVAEIMGKLIREGKIRACGQSSATLEQIKKANKITPISVIQSEYSMMERKWEKDVLPYCEENNIGFMAFSPLGNGFLSGKYNSSMEFKGNDVRRVITRFKKENMDANQPLLDMIKKFAEEKNCTSAQIALAWVMKKNFVVPIPGMRKIERISENLGSAEIFLSDEEYLKLTNELNKLKIYGDRDGKDIKKLGTVPDNVNK